jgi:mRNA interferase RelE/StbE
MPRYAIKIHKNAAKYLRALPANTRQRVRTKIDLLAENPYDASRLDIKPLEGEEGLWRLRTGSIRLIYEIVQERVLVYILTIRHRGDVYKKRR